MIQIRQVLIKMRCYSSKRAYATIEATFALFIFVLAIMLFVDMTRIAYVSAALQYTVSRSARVGALSEEKGQKRINAMTESVIDKAGNLGLIVRPEQIEVAEDSENSSEDKGTGRFTLRASTDMSMSPVTKTFAHLNGRSHDPHIKVSAQAVMRYE
jgi:Flp pilus assembly protein TadG